jgi:hypothetical protein
MLSTTIFFFVTFESLMLSSEAYIFSDKTITIGYESISENSTFLYDDDLINWINDRFPGLDIPLGSLTFNASLYRISQGLRPIKTNPIGEEIGFFIPPGAFVFYHKIFGRHLTNPNGEMGEIVSVGGLDPSQPFQLLPYTAGIAALTTNEGIETTSILVGMFDVIYTTGIFEHFSNGHVRVNSMTTLNPMLICNGTSFRFECIYALKFDSNHNLFWWDSYAWPWW